LLIMLLNMLLLVPASVEHNMSTTILFFFYMRPYVRFMAVFIRMHVVFPLLQAGAFTIVEEAAIAKGIRRIVAVTRQAAIDAYGAAEALRDEFGAARALPASGLSAVLPALTEKLNAAVIPSSAKLELRTALADLQAKSLEAWKAAQKARADAAVASITAITSEAEAAAVAAGKPAAFLVQQVDIGDDTKLASKVTTAVNKSCPHVAIMLVSVAEDKVYVACSVPDAVVSTGVKASEWLAAAVSVIGGRGGGKDNSAQGQGVGAARVLEVIAAANAFTADK
jgi:alanyl-tRNA synthetase